MNNPIDVPLSVILEMDPNYRDTEPAEPAIDFEKKSAELAALVMDEIVNTNLSIQKSAFRIDRIIQTALREVAQSAKQVKLIERRIEWPSENECRMACPTQEGFNREDWSACYRWLKSRMDRKI